MNEARNLRALTSTQTPLLGEENTPLHISEGGTGFEGATPRVAEIQTPNPLLTPRTDTSGLSTPRSDISAVEAKRSLRQGLAGLPVPRNEYEIRLPEMDDTEKKEEVDTKIEDQSEIDRREKELAEQQGKQRERENMGVKFI